MTANSIKMYSDAELESIRKETLRQDEAQPRAKSAHYRPSARALVIELKSGVKLEIPVDLIEGLAGASKTQLEKVELHPKGYALNWEELDVQMSVEGLVAGIFGSPRWMQKLASEWGRRGGKARSDRKAAAVRENGKLGGRPRKKVAA